MEKLSLPRCPDFTQRSEQSEWMDDPDASPADLGSAFQDIEQVNRRLGGKKSMKSLLKHAASLKLINSTTEIIDVGSAGGDLTHFIATELRGNGNPVKGIDRNPEAYEFARKKFKAPNLSFQCADVLKKNSYPSENYVVSSALFLHHFSESELVKLLTFWKKQNAKALLINDLQRTPMAYYGFRIISRLLNFSPMATFDGAISVLSGFTHRELTSLFNATGWNILHMRKSFPYRWEIIVIPE